MAQEPVDETAAFTNTGQYNVANSDRPRDSTQRIVQSEIEWSGFGIDLKQWIIGEHYGSHQCKWWNEGKHVE